MTSGFTVKQVSPVIFRIGNDWSFDDGISAKFNCIVRAFDPRYMNIFLFFEHRYLDGKIKSKENIAGIFCYDKNRVRSALIRNFENFLLF